MKDGLEVLRADPRARGRADRRERPLSTVAPGGRPPCAHGEVTVRPLSYGDANAWRTARRANADWLRPWDATVPPGGGDRPATFRALVRRLDRHGARRACMPFAVDVDGRFAGQVTVNNIVRGSAQFASVGYWLDRGYAGRGVMPLAVALVIDHCFSAAGLHRIEIAIRPENSNSLRVVEKLGLREFGYAPRFLHIDGAWRDHRLYAVTAEECPGGLRRDGCVRTPSSHTSSLATHLWTSAPPCASKPRLGPVDLSGLIFVALARGLGRLPDPQGAQAPRGRGAQPVGRPVLRTRCACWPGASRSTAATPDWS